MSTASFSTLSWAQRLAVISATNITDNQAATAFGVTVDELNTARESIAPDQTFDVTPYKSHFAKTATTKAGQSAKAKETIVRKKRGKPGEKIVKAVESITEQPQPFSDFCKKHGVSENTLKQLGSGRFEPKDQPGIHKGKFAVRKHDGKTCIWRVTETAAE